MQVQKKEKKQEPFSCSKKNAGLGYTQCRFGQWGPVAYAPYDEKASLPAQANRFEKYFWRDRVIAVIIVYHYYDY